MVVPCQGRRRETHGTDKRDAMMVAELARRQSPALQDRRVSGGVLVEGGLNGVGKSIVHCVAAA
jgi:hypothetical protein